MALFASTLQFRMAVRGPRFPREHNSLKSTRAVFGQISAQALAGWCTQTDGEIYSSFLNGYVWAIEANFLTEEGGVRQPCHGFWELLSLAP